MAYFLTLAHVFLIHFITCELYYKFHHYFILAHSLDFILCMYLGLHVNLCLLRIFLSSLKLAARVCLFLIICAYMLFEI